MNTRISLNLLAACILSACNSPAPQQDHFALADANKDGKLSRKEASDAVVEAVFKQYDTNHDGFLTFAEWEENDNTADSKLFAKRDTNHDGKVSLEEAKADANRQNIFTKTFMEADTDHDGLMSRDEAAAYSAKKEGPLR